MATNKNQHFVPRCHLRPFEPLLRISTVSADTDLTRGASSDFQASPVGTQEPATAGRYGAHQGEARLNDRCRAGSLRRALALDDQQESVASGGFRAIKSPPLKERPTAVYRFENSCRATYALTAPKSLLKRRMNASRTHQLCGASSITITGLVDVM